MFPLIISTVGNSSWSLITNRSWRYWVRRTESPDWQHPDSMLGCAVVCTLIRHTLQGKRRSRKCRRTISFAPAMQTRLYPYIKSDNHHIQPSTANLRPRHLTYYSWRPQPLKKLPHPQPCPPDSLQYQPCSPGQPVYNSKLIPQEVQ